jgi:ADP-dependent phosphofructokinase/glucokinase
MKAIACGFTANIDLLAKITPEFHEEIKSEAAGLPKAVIHKWEEFCSAVFWNIKKGSGAEYIVSNPLILKRLEMKLEWTKAIGGTGLQAGCAASFAGHPAIVNIPVISEELRSIVSEYEQLVLLSDQEGDVPKHYILEYTEGDHSNRIIFRNSNEFSSELIADNFLKELKKAKNEIGWLLLSGYNAFDNSEEIDLFLSNTIKIIDSLKNKKPKIHLELASIWSLNEQWKILHTLRDYVDSIGLNEDEFQELFGLKESLLSYDDKHFITTIEDACQTLDVSNLILHTKQFSLVVSDKHDTKTWSKALQNGNKFAFARAINGRICDFETIHNLTENSPINLRGEKLRQLTETRSDITICPSYLGETVSTIGLGDTFTAGLLVEAPIEFPPLRKDQRIIREELI